MPTDTPVAAGLDRPSDRHAVLQSGDAADPLRARRPRHAVGRAVRMRPHAARAGEGAGASRNVFRFVDGTSTWPVLLSRDLQAFVPNRQFQVVQLTHTDIEFRYVPGCGRPGERLAGADDLSPGQAASVGDGHACASRKSSRGHGRQVRGLHVAGHVRGGQPGVAASGVAVAEAVDQRS